LLLILFLEEEYGAFQEGANNLISTHGNKGPCGPFLFFQYLVEKAREDRKHRRYARTFGKSSKRGTPTSPPSGKYFLANPRSSMPKRLWLLG
jgi:hypothetical protein